MRPLVHAFASASAAERQAFHAGLSEAERVVLLRYALRMMTLARRTASEEPLVDALTALGMRMPGRNSEELNEDGRALCLCSHVMTASGMDRRVIFARAARGMMPEAAQHLLAFAKRPPEQQTLEASGLREHDTPYGVMYVGTW